MPFAERVTLLIALALLMNLPLGYLREGTRKFSVRWWVCIHASIPVIILLRLKMGISFWFIPLSLGSAVAGQFIGGMIKKTVDEA